MSTPLAPRRLDSVEELKQLQRTMAEVLFTPLSARGSRLQKMWRDGRSMRSVAEAFIKPNSRMTAVARLEIYARQYWFRLLDSLYDDFPACGPCSEEANFTPSAEPI